MWTQDRLFGTCDVNIFGTKNEGKHTVAPQRIMCAALLTLMVILPKRSGLTNKTFIISWIIDIVFIKYLLIGVTLNHCLGFLVTALAIKWLEANQDESVIVIKGLWGKNGLGNWHFGFF